MAVINFIDDDEPGVILAHKDCEPVNSSPLSSKAFGKSSCELFGLVSYMFYMGMRYLYHWFQLQQLPQVQS